MAIIRSKIARQLLADGGVSLDDAKMMAPQGEFLAYINPKEAGVLKSMGGSGKMTPMGIPSFTEDEEDQAAMNAPDYATQDLEEQQAIDAGEPTAQMSTTTRDRQGYAPGDNLSDLQAPSFFQNLGTTLKNIETNARMNRINRGILTTPGAIKSVFGLRDVPPELLATLVDDYTQGGLYSEGLVGGDISLANAASTFQGLEELGVDLTGDIRSQVGDISRSKFAERFGPKTKSGEGGDNEPIKKLKAPITEKKEEESKGEFDDILQFYGTKFARGGDVDYADQDLEEQQAIDAGEATAQMTTQERDDQGYGGGDADDLPTLAQTGPTVYSGGPTRNVSGFGLLGRPNPTMSKATRDKITRDILTEEDDITFGLDSSKQGTTGTKGITGTTGLGFDVKDVQPTSGYGGKRDRETSKALESFLQEVGPGFLNKADGGAIRQNYGLGSIVKKATRAVKKVAKSPLGKAAIFAGLGAYGLGAGPFASGSTMFGGKLAGLKGSGFLKSKFMKDLLLKKGKDEFTFGNLSPLSLLSIPTVASYLFSKKEEDEDETLPTVANTDPAFQQYLSFYGGPRRFAEAGGDIDEAPMKDMPQQEMASNPSSFAELNMLSLDLFGRPYDQLNDSEQEILMEYFSKSKNMPERTMAAGGGMMNPNDEMLNLGGNEMDLRGGGFVPLGEYEKKDDVPARLSKNEFVFTADAVKAAGGGSVDRGADIMYKTMKNLENKIA